MQSSLPALLGDVAVRVAWITLFLGIGVGLANVAVAFGAVDRVAGLAAPLTGPANLPSEVGTAIVATTASPTAGYGMLAEFRDAGVIDDRATLVAVTINTFFGFAQHILTFYVPVLIPILGVKVGVLYVAARGLVALTITLLGVLGGAVLLSGDAAGDPAAVDAGVGNADGDDAEDATTREKLAGAGAETVEKLREVLPRLAVIYTVVAFVVARYDVTAVTGVADPLAGLLGLPGAAVPTVAVFAVDTTNGAVFIAPFVENGTFTAREAVATMLVGGIVSFAVTTFKRSIPFQFGIWGPEFGTKVVVVNTVLKVAVIAVAVAALVVPL